MPTYNVTLSRAYIVKVRARNATMARGIAEFFLNDPPDASLNDPEARRRFGFKIEEIEMVENDAIRVEETSSL